MVGGPWVTVQEDYFEDLADVIFIGEAEETWPQFLREWQQGRHQYRYEQAEKTDMTQGADAAVRPAEDAALRLRQPPVLARLPVPVRVLRHHRHLRPPAPDQDQSRRSSPSSRRSAQTGMRIVFIVDDNLIGNKKAIKEVLRDVIAWQERNGYPLTFFTEASIDLADDPELMRADGRGQLHRRLHRHREPERGRRCARPRSFRTSAQGGTLLEKVHRIQDAGHGGLVRHDHGLRQRRRDDLRRQIEFIQDSRISFSMSGMLCAIPKTPLYDRLAARGPARPGRPSRSSAPTSSPCRSSREELRDGYVRVLNELYEPEAYFERTDALFLDPSFDIGITKKRSWWRISPRWMGSEAATRSRAWASSPA